MNLFNLVSIRQTMALGALAYLILAHPPSFAKEPAAPTATKTVQATTLKSAAAAKSAKRHANIMARLRQVDSAKEINAKTLGLLYDNDGNVAPFYRDINRACSYCAKTKKCDTQQLQTILNIGYKQLLMYPDGSPGFEYAAQIFINDKPSIEKALKASKTLRPHSKKILQRLDFQAELWR